MMSVGISFTKFVVTSVKYTLLFPVLSVRITKWYKSTNSATAIFLDYPMLKANISSLEIPSVKREML